MLALAVIFVILSCPFLFRNIIEMIIFVIVVKQVQVNGRELKSLMWIDENFGGYFFFLLGNYSAICGSRSEVRDDTGATISMKAVSYLSWKQHKNLLSVSCLASSAPNGNSRISGKFPISFFQAIMSQRLDAVMSNGRCLITVRY